MIGAYVHLIWQADCCAQIDVRPQKSLSQAPSHLFTHVTAHTTQTQQIKVGGIMRLRPACVFPLK